ncbi:Ig-like domain-containing protein [Limnohabitans planktonicus]|uniref:Ig-like domain-containing protein n=1 Tax=Limnohabitans planktonicus TaxID=540060 RepID=UPI000AAC2830|nr:Ig-like domain-containing protein [Limnohabitans planktonicus]
MMPINININSAAPTIALSITASTIATGQTATITFTLSEASAEFTTADITTLGGTITGLTQSPTNPLVYTATITPTAGATSVAVLVSSNKFADAAGNINLDGVYTKNAQSFSFREAPAPTDLTATLASTSDSGVLETNPTGASTTAQLPITIVVDTAAPKAPAAMLSPSSNSGLLTDTITTDTTPTLSGSGTPGDTITIKVAAGKTIATAVVPVFINCLPKLKMMSSFIIFSILSFNVFAQVTPFDFIEASKKMNQAERALQNLNSKKNYGEKCETIQTSSGEAVATCAVLPEDYKKLIVKIEYPADQIPDLMQKQITKKFVQDVKNKKLSCIYRYIQSNDNQVMVGRGLNPDKNENLNIYGDDFYRTHGLAVGISCASEDGISNSFGYSTELYSDPDLSTGRGTTEGNVSMNQKFTSENIFSFIQDNINKGNFTYWKRGVGFINLSDKKKWGLLQSTGQQQWFHNVLNRVSKASSYEYTYEEGSKDTWGAFVTLAIGLQENRKIGDRCQLKLNADVGGRISTLKDTSTFNINAQAKLAYLVTDNLSVYLRAQSEKIERSSSQITENTLAAGVESQAGSYLELGAMGQRGNRKDVPDRPNFFTGKNDLQVILKVGYKY